MRSLYLTTTLFVCTASPRCGYALASDPVPTFPDRSDRAALGTIFADQHATESALDVHRRAMRMPVEERFELLSSWVLPNENHSTFRLEAGFSSTHPAPPVADAHFDPAARVQTGGSIVSPALDLIDAASSLNKLHELRKSVEAAPLVSTQSHKFYDQWGSRYKGSVILFYR